MQQDNINKKGVSALKRAKSQVGKKCLLGVNYCLYNVQEWFKSPHIYPSAISQWNNIDKKYKHKNDKTAPNGTPVFFKGGKYGHIAIATGVNQNIVSTDFPNKSYVNITTIDKLCKGWGYEYLGWTETISINTFIYTKKSATVSSSYKTYEAKAKTKVFEKPNTKYPLIKNRKKIWRKKCYKIKAKVYSANWLITNKGNYYLKKRFK